MNKDILKTLEEIDKTNDYASFLSENTLSVVNDWIDTGSYVLNAIISGSIHGGIPDGRITLFAGDSMTGKSYIIQRILGIAQKAGRVPVIYDTENAIDADGAKRLGLDPTKTKYVPVSTIEETKNSIFKFLKRVIEAGQEGKFIIAIDSLGNLDSELEVSRMEKGVTSPDMGSRARAMGSMLRSLTHLAAKARVPIIASNHVYDDPAALFPSLTKHMPGGKKVAYLPSVTVQLARKPVKDDGGKTLDGTLAVGQKKNIGVVLRALTVKNRFIKQYLEGEMYLSFSDGLSKYYGLVDLAVGLGALVQTGSTYQLPDGTKLGYYKSFRKDVDLWENTILPVIEDKIKVEWAYSNENKEDDPDEDIDE